MATVHVPINGVATPLAAGRAEFEATLQNDFQRIVMRDDLRDVFFNPEVFAEPVRYWHATIDAWQTYNAIFDDPTTTVGVAGAGDYLGLRQQIMVAQSALRHRIMVGDKVRARGVTYVVDDWEQDGVGVVTMFLRMEA